MVLTGKYEHSVDSKNRLFIPAKHREILGESFMITRSTDRCLSVRSMVEWEKYTAKLNELPATEMRGVLRFIYSNAQSATPDGQGRIILTPEQMAFAGIRKNAVIIGVGDHAEIWSEENWKEQTEKENLEDITALLIRLGM
ncbi:MAG: division/cell wall cluster transcriptional repressor MraZ [Clostridia bacterium]|nr:division/cell wall cluster transcriptional repressor MraZ [Clostridia bacterium]